MQDVDVLVVGGGINGVGIARDAAGRGLSVLLCEKDDLASHTSSWSTKLIHGGLRYLEHREFRLVREALIEREVLLTAAPHLVSQLRFILPHHDGLRPSWLLRLGLFLYDHIGGRKILPPTKVRDLSGGEYGAPLSDKISLGFEYTDCRVDDSRLVITNALDAAARGATIKTRTELTSAEKKSDHWQATCTDSDGKVFSIRAKVIVNAAGPWVTSLFTALGGAEPRKKLRLVKGSHLITKKLYAHDRAYIFQNSDGRIVFTIPYLNDTTLIGTTDVPYEGNPADACISEDEIDYLLSSVSAYLAKPVDRASIVGSFSGVRPLYDDLGASEASAVTRDYAFDIERDGGTTLLSVYGGKLTTYRKLAEHAVDKLRDAFPQMGSAWTRGASLPGGQVAYEEWDAFRTKMHKRFSFLPAETIERMIRAYGTRLPFVLGDAQTYTDLGQDFGNGLTEREVIYLIEHEWATKPEDVLTRRTKLGSLATPSAVAALEAFMDRALAPNSAAA